MKRKGSTALYLCIGAVAVLVATAIILAVMIVERRNQLFGDAQVILNGETQKEMSVDLEGLAPGEEQSYTIRFKADETATYDITMTFTRTGNTDLARYVDAKLVIGDKVIKEAPLTELLEGNEIAFAYDFKQDVAVDLVITYSVDASYGNEMMCTEAYFNIDMVAKDR